MASPGSSNQYRNYEEDLTDLLHKIEEKIYYIDHLDTPGNLVYSRHGVLTPSPNKGNQAVIIEQKEQLSELYDLLETLQNLCPKTPERDPSPDDLITKEFIATVKTHKGRHDPEAKKKCLEMLNKAAELSDLTLEKFVEETNRDKQLRIIRQAIEDKESKLLPPNFRKIKSDLSAELGLVLYKGKIVVPNSLKQLILQIAHGDHEGVPKMLSNLEPFYWPEIEEDLKRKSKQCLTCFRAGKNLKPLIPNCRINRLPPSTKTGELVQIDFIGPVLNEKNKKRYIGVAIDNYSKWPVLIVCKTCSRHNAVKLLDLVCENLGLPETVRLENAKCFKSRKFGEFISQKKIKLEFVTPHLHSANGSVERQARTIQDYMKTFLLEGNSLKQAVRRITKVLRFTESSAIKMSPFEKLTGNKPRTVLTNLLNLDYPDASLMKTVRDSNGKILGNQLQSKENLEKLEKKRKWGRSRNVEDLRSFYVESKKPPKVRKFIVERNRNQKGWDSKFQDKILEVEKRPKIP